MKFHLKPNLSPHPQKNPCQCKWWHSCSGVTEDSSLPGCDAVWLPVYKPLLQRTYCFELRNQAVMATLSDLKDEYTMLLHNIGNLHPMTRSHPKRTESCCVLADLWHNTSSSFTVLCSWEHSVRPLSFASQHLWCLELSSYLDSQQHTANCYQSSSLSSLAVGNELHTEYNVIFIKYNFTWCKIIT